MLTSGLYKFFRFLRLTYFLWILVFTFGCLEEINDIDKVNFTWDPALAIPIVDSDFSIVDFLGVSASVANIQTDSTGLVILSFRNQLVSSQNASQLFSFPNQAFSSSMSINSGDQSLVPITATISNQMDFQKDFQTTGGERLDSLILKDGVIKAEISSEFPASGEVILTFRSLQKNGKALKLTLPLDFDGTTLPVNAADSADLDGFSLALADAAKNGNAIDYGVAFTLSFENQLILFSNSVFVDIQLNGLKFSAAFGDLGTKSVSAPVDSIAIDIFNNIAFGSLILDDPRFTFEFENGFGIDTGIDLGSFATVAADQESLFLSGPIIDNQQIILGADIANLGTPTTSFITINRDNSNIVDLFSIAPILAIFKFNGTLNPNGTTNHFVLDSSRINVFLEAELPLSGGVQNLTIVDDFNIDGTQFEDAKSFAFKFDTENQFPFGVGLQAFFKDSLGVVLDSLFQEIEFLVPPAPVDANGIVTQPVSKTVITEIEGEAAERIKRSVILTLVVVLDSQTAQGLNLGKILDSYILSVDIGVRVEIEIDLD